MIWIFFLKVYYNGMIETNSLNFDYILTMSFEI